MIQKNNIMLLLVICVISSLGKKHTNIPDPTDVDYQDIIDQSVKKQSNQMFLPGFSQELKSDLFTNKDNLEVTTLEQIKRVNEQEYRLKSIPLKEKHGIKESHKKYAWNTEERSRLKKDVRVYLKNQNNFNLRTVQRLLDSLIQKLNLSIRIVGAHYLIVANCM